MPCGLAIVRAAINFTPIICPTENVSLEDCKYLMAIRSTLFSYLLAAEISAPSVQLLLWNGLGGVGY